jgi:hypothetical protein
VGGQVLCVAARGVSVEDRENHIVEGCGGEDGKNVDKETEAGQAYFIFRWQAGEEQRIELFALVGVLDPQPVYGNCSLVNLDPQLDRETLVTGPGTIT